MKPYDFMNFFIEVLSKPIMRVSDYANAKQELAALKKINAQHELDILDLRKRLADIDTPGHSIKQFASFDLGHTISKPAYVAHGQWIPHLSREFNKPGVHILEVGSRNVTGGASRQPFDAAHYVGFDFYPGDNVDIVGDAHKLSTYFGPDEKFDLVFSSAVFEHLYAPWLVAQEMQKVLKLGGHLFVETHFSYISHERPWNFFQFSDMGLRALFNKALGFEVLDCGMCNPMNGVFSDKAEPYLRGLSVGELYCHSEIFCQKVADPQDFDWRRSGIDDIVEATRYPAPNVAAT